MLCRVVNSDTRRQPEIGRESPERCLVGVMNPLTVSTAQLRTFLPLHLQPINLVVFQGSHVN